MTSPLHHPKITDNMLKLFSITFITLLGDTPPYIKGDKDRQCEREERPLMCTPSFRTVMKVIVNSF